MKATSKLISVVLILAMCLSMFTVSAFAAPSQVIVIPMEGNELGGNSSSVYEGGVYVGSGAGETESTDVTAAQTQTAAGTVNPVPSVATVSTAEELVRAAANGGEIKLANSVTLADTLSLSAGTILDLSGYSLTFSNSGAAKDVAIAGNGAVIKNGTVNVSGNEQTDAQGVVQANGFRSAASGVTLNGVNVYFTAPASWSMFGAGVVPGYGAYSRDVSAYFANSTTVEVVEQNGVYVVQDKVAAPEAPSEPVAETVSEVAEEPVAESEEAAGEPAGEGEEVADEQSATEEVEETPAEESASEDSEVTEERPAAEEVEETPDEQPADETPVDVVEEEEKVYEEEIRVDMAEEEDETDVVTLTGVDEVSGAVVIISGKNLPEGLTVVVKAVSNDSLGELKEGEEALLVLDISLVDAEGNEYEPKDDPNVGAVSVQIKHASLGNLEEDESLTLYHVVDDVAQNVASATQTAEDTLEFATGSFSLYGIVKTPGTTGSTLSGGDGEVHKKVITIKNTSGDIYVKKTGGTITFEVYGGSAPESISIVDPDSVSSGNINVFKAGYLEYGNEYTISPAPSSDPTADPFTVTIKNDAVINATAGKYAVVFWFKDTTDDGTTTRVYMVQYVTIVPKAEIKALLPEDEWGDYYFNKCSYDPMEFYLTAELDKLTITGPKGTVVNYDYSTDKKHVTVKDLYGNTKTYNLSDMLTVSDYTAYDPVSHEFIGGKTLKLLPNLIKKLDFADYKIYIEQKNHSTTPDNAANKTFTVSLRPGITVADGLNDYIKGTNIWIKFEACWPIDYDENGKLCIWIGGQQISKDYYSISNDHQTLWIYRNLLDQLRSNNSYTLTARLWRLSPIDGTKETFYPASTSFNILAAGSTSYKSPKTGDNSNVALWAAVLVLSGGAVVALIPKKKKAKVGK